MGAKVGALHVAFALSLNVETVSRLRGLVVVIRSYDGGALRTGACDGRILDLFCV